jgi:four helix bundle protein
MKFEELEVWKRSTKLSGNIYKELRELRDYGFRDQITRSGLSIPSNIAEGFERGSQKENIVFLSYAKGSSGELRTQIYIGMEIGYIDKKVGEEWLKEGREISSMLSGLIKTKRGFLENKKLFCATLFLILLLP